MAGIGIRPLGEDDPKRLGPYRLLWRLTSGGMGRIHLGRSAPDGPLVAVKTLLAEGVVSEPDRRRFAREVELAQRIDSACTARMREADARAERPWMAIDFVPAPSLGDLVRTAGRLPASAIPWLAAGTVQALLALHDKGVVHRDVKPQNILLPLTGPLVIDFGISHAIDKTATALTLGTIDYTSPEQALGQRSTQASDVFSLGATLFHLAVGRAPYPESDDGPLQRLARVQAGTLDLTGLPPELAPLIRPCLAFEPEQRPTLDDLLPRFLDEADQEAVRQDSRHWLPLRWKALIDAYEAHGRVLDKDPGAAEAMADEHTRPVPPPPPVLIDAEERAARREREEQAREAREFRDRELHDLAAVLRARAAEEEAAAEQWRAERREAEERAAERLEATRLEAERHAADRREADRLAAAPRSNQGGPAGALAVVVVLVIALLVWHPWTGDGDTDSTGGASSVASGVPLVPSDDGSPGDDPNGAPVDTNGAPHSTTGTGRSGPTDDSTDGTALDTPSDAPTTTAPATDPTEEAFDAVRIGDCLPVYDTGSGGTRIVWSAATPPSAVSCTSQFAGLVQVTARTSGSCPNGMGEASWSYTSPDSGDTTRLCVTRIYLPHYCMLGEQSGDSVSIGPMTVVDCSTGQVPTPYNQVMYIAGVHAASSGADASDCAQGGSDRTRYWAWVVDGGRTLLCTTVYQRG